ncbi:unnamed protein product [Rotaria magnacalcarata]
MGQAAVSASHTLKNIEWMWQSNPNPFSESEPVKWSHYSDLETLIIEGAYSTKQPQAILDDYYIDFKQNLQISNIDSNKQRPIKRVQRKRDDKHLREERFMDLPVGTGRSFSGQYGWVSPFIIEVRRHLGLQPDQLPSKDPQLIPMLVEKAAQGIITEAIYIRKQREAEKLAEVLLEKKNKKMKEVWQCCAYLYTLESFLYKTINAAMRLIGDKDHEEVWRSKVGTLGPFCLLLWDDPYNTKATIEKTLYRGANLTPEQIAAYEEMVKHKNEYRSFQAYTSCSRNRKKAEEFGNTLFIMDVLYAFIADLSSLSEYADEEEELVTPGVCFRVKNVEFDQGKNQHLINLELRQRFSIQSYLLTPQKH